MHCTSQSLLRGAFGAALRQPATQPPAFLLPSALAAAAPFSTTPSLARKRLTRRDANPARGTSALRRTGLKKQRLSVSLSQLPKPVLDPERRTQVHVDPDHGLWGFFTVDKEVLQIPEAVVAHGRSWTVAELRLRDWDDLHRLWWVCVKELNRIRTMEVERERVKAGFGEWEAGQRITTVETTMKGIKFVLTERWYAWEQARWDAMADPSVDMYAEESQHAYDQSKEVIEVEDAFEKAEAQPERSTDMPPAWGAPSGGQDARI